MMRSRLLIVTTQAENAGAQKAALKLYEYMQGLNIPVKTSYLYSLDERYTKYLRDRYDCHVFMSTRSFSELFSLLRIRRVVKENNITHVVSYTHWANILVPLLLMGCGVKIFANKRGLLWNYPKIRLLEGLILKSRLVSKVICVSHGAYAEGKEQQFLPENKLSHIPNGIDIPSNLEKREYTEGETFNLLFVGRLHEQKGIDFLVSGYCQFIIDNPSVNHQLTVVGGGELSPNMRSKLDSSGVSRFINFVGNVPDVEKYYLKSHLIISTSLWEGFPNVLLEAASYCLPIIATDIEGTSELIEHKVNGYLFPPSDSDAIAAAIEYSLYNYDEMVTQSVRLFSELEKKYSNDLIRESYYKVIFE